MTGFLSRTRRGCGGDDCRRAAGVSCRRPLTAARLSRGDARLILPSCSPFLQLRDFGQLVQRRARQIRRPEQDSLDAGKTEIAGLQRSGGAAEPAVKARTAGSG